MARNDDGGRLPGGPAAVAVTAVRRRNQQGADYQILTRSSGESHMPS